MKFHEWETLWDKVKSRFPRGADMIDAYVAQIEQDRKDGDQLSYACNLMELGWWQRARPYYKVFPAISKSLCSLKLDCGYECPIVPGKTIAVRFAVGCEPMTNTGIRIASMLVAGCKMKSTTNTEPRSGLSIMVQSDDPNASKTTGDYAFIINPDTKQGETIESVISTGEVHVKDFGSIENVRGVQLLCTRIAITICLLADDPSIITPDVLSSDRDRYNNETDEAWKQRAVDRARRRGVVGWNIGADYEVCPHYRRPHFGLRHTGKGRTVPRIVPIKGAVVHRNRLTEVPTGWMTPDGREVEPVR